MTVELECWPPNSRDAAIITCRGAAVTSLTVVGIGPPVGVSNCHRARLQLAPCEMSFVSQSSWRKLRLACGGAWWASVQTVLGVSTAAPAAGGCQGDRGVLGHVAPTCPFCYLLVISLIRAAGKLDFLRYATVFPAARSTEADSTAVGQEFTEHPPVAHRAFLRYESERQRARVNPG